MVSYGTYIISLIVASTVSSVVAIVLDRRERKK